MIVDHIIRKINTNIVNDKTEIGSWFTGRFYHFAGQSGCTRSVVMLVGRFRYKFAATGWVVS